MKILIVSQYFTPDITAAAFRIGETYELLKKAGHDVKVITTFPHKSDVEIEEDFEEDISRVKVSELGGGGLKNYLKHYLSFIPGSIKAAKKLRRNGWKPDVIWVSSPPLFTGISGWRIKKIMKAPFIFDIRDIWPDTAVAAGQLSETGKAYKVGRFLELFLYKRADRLTCVSAPMKKYLQEQSPKKDITVIYNAVSEQAVPKESEKKQNEQSEGKILTYAGNLGYLQGLDVLIEAFNKVQTEKELAKNWRIHLYGAGAEEKKLKELTQKYGLEEKVIFKGVVSKEEVQGKLNEADMLFFSLKSHPVLEKTIPSKLFDYLIVGKPIIGGIKGEGKKILEKVEANATFEAGDVQDLTEKLKKAFTDIEKRTTSARNNITLVKENYTREKMTEKLESLFIETVRQ